MNTIPHPTHAVVQAAWPNAAAEDVTPDDLAKHDLARNLARDDLAPDDFAWWRQALAGATLPIHENEPQPGYYRVRESKAGAFLAVAMWREKRGHARPEAGPPGRCLGVVDLVLPAPDRL